MNGSHESDRLDHDSEVIAGFLPLVDVLLAVLCVALVAAGARGTFEVPVVLPQDHGQASTAVGSSALLHVNRSGQLALEGQPVALADLSARLRLLPTATTVLVAGDAAVPYEYVAQVLSRLHQSGLAGARLVLQNLSR